MRKPAGSGHLLENVLGDINRDSRRHAERNRVARPAVDLEHFSVFADVYRREERVLFEVVDLDPVDLASELLNHVGEKIVSHGPG